MKAARTFPARKTIKSASPAATSTAVFFIGETSSHGELRPPRGSQMRQECHHRTTLFKKKSGPGKGPLRYSPQPYNRTRAPTSHTIIPLTS